MLVYNSDLAGYHQNKPTQGVSLRQKVDNVLALYHWLGELHAAEYCFGYGPDLSGDGLLADKSFLDLNYRLGHAWGANFCT